MGIFLQDLKKSIKTKNARIAFPESTDLRILQAMNQILKDEIVSEIYIFDSREKILDLAKQHSLNFLRKHSECLRSLEGDNDIVAKDLEEFLRERMKHKPVSEPALKELAESALYKAGYLLSQGKVDSVLAGACTETSHVIRAALRMIGQADGVRTVSGSFIMQRKEEIFLFADCGVNIEPTLEELVDIACESRKTWDAIPFLAKQEAHMAFLSFSTKGSAKHKSCIKMAEAAERVKALHPNWIVDGELQFDAAFDRDVGKRKAPGSAVAGSANIFIFPDLNSANIAYKIAQRLGSFAAYGPLLQGLNKPYSDLSRGATVEDIVTCTYINLVRALT